MIIKIRAPHRATVSLEISKDPDYLILSILQKPNVQICFLQESVGVTHEPRNDNALVYEILKL